MKNPRKTPFVQGSLRNRVKQHLKNRAMQPYKFAEIHGIPKTTVYRLLAGMNVHPDNYNKIKNSLNQQPNESNN